MHLQRPLRPSSAASSNSTSFSGKHMEELLNELAGEKRSWSGGHANSGNLPSTPHHTRLPSTSLSRHVRTNLVESSLRSDKEQVEAAPLALAHPCSRACQSPPDQPACLILPARHWSTQVHVWKMACKACECLHQNPQ